MIQLGGWRGPVNFVDVGMDDFDVVLRMEFLLEHQVILTPSAKCLVIIRSISIVVQTDLHHPNGLRMISAMKLKEGLARDETTFRVTPFEFLDSPGETVRKDIRCVVDKYCDGMLIVCPSQNCLQRMLVVWRHQS